MQNLIFFVFGGIFGYFGETLLLWNQRFLLGASDGIDCMVRLSALSLFDSLYASTMILTGMTVERCIAVTYPFSMSRPKSAMYRAKVTSAVAWSLATLCSIPQVRMWSLLIIRWRDSCHRIHTHASMRGHTPRHTGLLLQSSLEACKLMSRTSYAMSRFWSCQQRIIITLWACSL